MLYVKEPDLKKLKSAAINHWKLFVLSMAGCMCLAAAYLLIKNKQWYIQTSVAIADTGASSNMASMMAKSAGFGDILGIGGGAVDNEIVIMQSHTVVRDAVKELGLNVVYTNRPKIKRAIYFQDSPIELVSDSPIMGDTLNMGLIFKVKVSADGKHAEIYGKTSLRDEIIDIEAPMPAHFDTEWGSFTLRTTSFFEEGESVRMKIYYNSYSGAAQGLMEDLEYDLVDKKANVISIGLKDMNPNKAKALLNTIVKKYEAYSLQAKNINTEYNMSYLQRRIDTLNLELANLEYAIEEYKENNDLSDIEKQIEVALAQASTAREQQLILETQYEVVRHVEAYVKDPANRFAPIPLNLGVEANDATTALNNYNMLIQEYQRVLQTTKSNNPLRVQMEQQIETARQTVITTIESVKHGIEFSREKVNEQLAQFESMAKNMPRQEREFIELKRQQELKQKIFVMLLAQQEQNAVNLLSEVPKAQLVDEAYCSARPVTPKPKLILAAAFIFALFLPVVWIKFLAFMNKRVASPDDLQKEGAIKDIYCLSSQAEDIHSLRSAIIAQLKQHNNLLATFSMQADEEQTKTAYALAKALAATDRKVAWLNANLREADAEVYEQMAGIEIVQPDILPDQLESLAFAKTIEQLQQTYDVVIINTADFVRYPDALPILQAAGTQMLVTKRNITLKENLRYVESLHALGYLNNLITVFND